MAASAGRECSRCGSAAEAGQEYCLECGSRLPADAAAAGLPRRRAGGGAGWALLATGAVALVAASAVSALQLTGEERPVLVATSPQPTVLPTTEETVTEVATSTAPEPATTAAPPQRPASARTGRLISWPEGESGWTLVLASIPTGPGNRALATRQAREAADKGLRQVGVLVSAEFSSLHPGYLVVFAGVYDNRGAAEQALSRAGSLGYEAAYTREIVP